MKKLMIMVMLVAITCTIAAGDVDENAGKYGFQSLKISPSAAIGALGGTGGFNAFDAAAFIINPTAVVQNKTRAVSAGQNTWVFDEVVNTVAFARVTGKQGFAIGLRWLDYEAIDKYAENGDYLGDFSPMDANIIFNYAYRLSPDFIFGMNSHIIFEELDTASSIGYAFDGGLTWLSPLKGLDFALRAKHLGKAGKMDNESPKLPASYEFNIHKMTEFNVFTMDNVINMQKYPDDDSAKIKIGTQFGWKNKLFVRGGYRTNDDTHDMSMGVGAVYRHFAFDFAYLPSDVKYADASMINIGYTF